jgi:hypothetical protein
MHRQLLVGCLMAASLAGCGGPKFEYVNERGGVLSIYGANEKQGMTMAAAHCEKHQRRIRFTGQPEPWLWTFECV